MRLRKLAVLLIVILTAACMRLPDALQLAGTNAAVYADAEVSTPEEFCAAMREAIRSVKDSVKVRIAKYDENTYNVDSIFKRVLSENSGLGFVAGCSATITTSLMKDSAVVELKLQYLYPAEKIRTMRDEVENKANEIIKTIIKHGMSDYDKVLAVHDHIIKNSRYDRLNADSNTVPPEEHEAYGVLVKGAGVCDSYAKAMKLLLEKAEVQCIIVEGSKVEATVQGNAAVDHAWNIVKLDGEYYHIDATWDDAYEEKDSTELIYHHFNLNDEEMKKTHVWDKTQYPACSGIKYNYFMYNKLVARNRAEAVAMLSNTISEREKRLMIKLADYKSSVYDIEGMIKDAAEKIRFRQRISAKWIINDSLGTVDMEFEY